MGVVGVEAESCRCDWRVAQGSNVSFIRKIVCNVRSTGQRATALCQPTVSRTVKQREAVGRSCCVALYRSSFDTEMRRLHHQVR
jgi:hypothetical protein